jgi:hypothetical protein
MASSKSSRPPSRRLFPDPPAPADGGPALLPPAASSPAVWRGVLLAALQDGGPLVLTVRGASMAPGLADGDRIEIARPRLYLPGDVVAFADPEDRLVVHRLLGFRPWRGGLAAVTRGDACPRPDPPVPRSRLLGRVIGRPDLTPPSARAGALAGLLAIAWAGLRQRAGRRSARA